MSGRWLVTSTAFLGMSREQANHIAGVGGPRMLTEEQEALLFVARCAMECAVFDQLFPGGHAFTGNIPRPQVDQPGSGRDTTGVP
jgi:hypothetical protein